MSHNGTASSLEAVVAASDPGGDVKAIESLQDWPALCDLLRATVEKSGISQRDLVRRATRKGLSLPRSTLSRMLKGDGRPSRSPLENLLQVLDLHEEIRRTWIEAWGRIAVARADPAVRAVMPEVGEDGRVASEDVIYEIVADIVDIAKAVAMQIVEDVGNELRDVVFRAQADLSDARSQIDVASKEHLIAVAQAKREAEEILKRARGEAADIVRSSRTSGPMIDESILRDSGRLNISGPSPTDFSIRPISPALYSISAQSAPTGKSQTPSVEEPKKKVAKSPATSAAQDQKKQSPMPESDAKPPPPKLTVGDRVRHDKYGMGTVTLMEGEGPRATVTIEFDETGSTRLMLIGGVPLKRVEGHDAEEPRSPAE